MNDPKAQQRALLIMQVQAGVISATEAARQLGISRKTYYKWERRALKALLSACRPPRRFHAPHDVAEPVESFASALSPDLDVVGRVGVGHIPPDGRQLGGRPRNVSRRWNPGQFGALAITNFSKRSLAAGWE